MRLTIRETMSRWKSDGTPCKTCECYHHFKQTMDSPAEDGCDGFEDRLFTEEGCCMYTPLGYKYLQEDWLDNEYEYRECENEFKSEDDYSEDDYDD